ncbi:hypothetical protein OEB99_04615 [Actinotalea sp. M2MS4P-6]|uniref:hypothetical protein n=1 Tax=Actinotalea sp. M2MS4P-6 TaxID=2983762 RepID=UPI0021E3C01E|nr:hypothetical protein [Actinotalea sp. M2MS4P-6]MCV2393583.1 hypothetical protein [Actinotalea sp. M2MS4P-6]
MSRDDVALADREVAEPLVETWPWARALFAERTTLSGVVWLLVRVLLGWQWLSAGIGKLGSYDAWRTGAAVKGFATSALAETTGDHPAVISGTFGWNKAWLTWVADSGYRLIGPVIPFLEITVGALLVLGLFTGIAAAFGLLLNLSFLFAGSLGVNPVFAITAVLLVVAWRVAGYCGLDRWVLPLVGVPWARPASEHRTREPAAANAG